MHRNDHFATKSKTMPIQSLKMHDSKGVHICVNDKIKLDAITQESVKYQNKKY